MVIKLGSIVAVIMFMFLAKVSFESATGESHKSSYRGPASIDQSYTEYNTRVSDKSSNH